MRIFESGKQYGHDPYEWSAFVRWLDDDEVEILGALQAPTLSQWKAMDKFFRAQGITKVKIKRVRDGQVEKKAIV